ncbi:MAG: hypothetical protein JNJ98_18920 [Gemmatimonadetes bacterium]|nr:hypothetical protein [Gemmatimonadota bacterium]
MEPDRGAAADGAAPVLKRLGYLTGRWSVQNFVRDSSGRFVELPVRSFMRARYLRDGRSLLVEYHEAKADGFHGVHLVTADPTRGLVHRYSDARRNQRVEFSGRFDGDRYVISRVGGYNDEGPFLYREVDGDIRPDAFVKRLYRSDDGGVSWSELGYYYRFVREP